MSVYTPRFATPEDLDAIYDLLLLQFDEIGMGSLDEAKAKARVALCIDRRTGFAIVIEDGTGAMVASLGCFATQHWYSADWFLQETWVFVHPDHRRSSNAKVLLSAGRRTAAEIGLPLVLAVLTNKRTEGKCRLFARHFKPVGQLFISSEGIP